MHDQPWLKYRVLATGLCIGVGAVALIPLIPSARCTCCILPPDRKIVITRNSTGLQISPDSSSHLRVQKSNAAANVIIHHEIANALPFSLAHYPSPVVTRRIYVDIMPDSMNMGNPQFSNEVIDRIGHLLPSDIRITWTKNQGASGFAEQTIWCWRAAIVVASGGIAFIASVGIVLKLWLERPRRTESVNKCICGYDIGDIDSSLCPECGRSIRSGAIE